MTNQILVEIAFARPDEQVILPLHTQEGITAIAAIEAGQMQATALQPAVLISRMAVDEANAFLKSGSTGKPEMQVIPCDLVTKANAANYVDFEKKQ